MNTKTLAALGAVLALAAVYAQADHFGTAFTYQGQLVSGGQAANGLYDLQFKLYDSLAGGTGQVGGTLTSNAVPVANGLFTVALDFGDGVFTGPPRWLEIAVRTNAAVTFVTLSPRQQLNPSPYALFTPNADVAVMATTANSVANNAVTAPGIAPGNVVKSVNALKDDVILAQGANLTLAPSGQTITLSSPTDWHIGGNASTTPGVNFLGTTDNQPLELHINGTRALRLEPNTYAENNAIGGAWVNTVDAGVVGATIGGGGSWNRGGHRISANYGTIAGGGYGNQIRTNADNSTIGGGADNLILSNAFQSTIAGGFYHQIQENAYDSTIAGGWQNWIERNASGATIAGGTLNTVHSNANTATIAGGGSNHIQTNASNSTIAGGVANAIQHDAFSAAIGGGQLNQILPYAGGAVIGGGSANTNGGSYATVPGGQNNLAGGAFSFAAGQRAKAAHQGAFVWADSQAADFSSTANNQFLIRAAGNVGINKNNPATALDVNGTVTANNFVGSGGGLTGIGAGSLGPSVDARYVLKAGDTMSGLLTTPNLAALTAVRTPWVNNDAGSVLSISSGGDIEFQIDKLGPAFSYFEVFNGAGSHVFWVDEAGNSQVYGTQIVNGDQHVDGKVGIGTNNPVAVLDVYGTRAIDATTDGVLNVGDSASSHLTLDGDDIQRKYGTTPSTLYLNYYGGNVNVCAGQLYTVFGSGVGIGTSGLSGYKLYVAGSAYSTGVWSGSDARWKKNVQPVTRALDKITQLQGVTYDWRRDEFPAKQFEAGTQLGFLAQEVEKVVPEAVRTDAEGYKAIAYEKLTAVLTEGVKEQQAEIGALKARNATLEKDVAELKALVEQLLHK